MGLALAFQRKLEAKQLKENTFVEYAKYFQGMINRMWYFRLAH